MRRLVAVPLSSGLALKKERPYGTPIPAIRPVLEPSRAPIKASSRQRLQPLARSATHSAPDVAQAANGDCLDTALHELQDLFFASCVDYPSDERLQQRMRAHCRDIEARLGSVELREWRSSRDCLLARLGFQLLHG